VIDRRDVAARHRDQADRRVRAQALVGEPVALLVSAYAEGSSTAALSEADALMNQQTRTALASG
jgi:hypothetical protein